MIHKHPAFDTAGMHLFSVERTPWASAIFEHLERVETSEPVPDTVIMHPRVYGRLFRKKPVMGNSHQRRKARRHNARIEGRKNSLFL